MLRRFKIYLAIFVVVVLGVGFSNLYSGLNENYFVTQQAKTESTASVVWSSGVTSVDAGVIPPTQSETSATATSLTQQAATAPATVSPATQNPTTKPTATKPAATQPPATSATTASPPVATAAPTPLPTPIPPPTDTTAGASVP